MPISSQYPSFELPELDLWRFIFERETEFPDDQVIFQDIESDRHYTFASVRETSKSFASNLQKHFNFSKGQIISVFTSNDVDVGPCTYGALYAGGIVCPVNPAYSATEFAFMLKDAGARIIVTQASLLPVAYEAAGLAGIPRTHIILLGAERDTAGQAKHFVDLSSNGASEAVQATIVPTKDLAFLVYSSGTTGLPKGVMLNHRNVIADILMINGSVGRAYSWKNDRLLGVLPFFHIYGLTGLVHQTLHRGIQLFVMPKFGLETFLRTIQNQRITFAYVAPPVLVQLSRAKEAAEYDLSSLRMLTSGAAPLTQELVDAIFKQHKLKVNQAYGLSETSPMTHTQPWDEWYSSVGSVGKLFPNMTAKFVDLDGKEVEAGKTGELWLKGPNVFQGYWNRPQESQNAISSDGYFKTGDIGHSDQAHNCYITDRLKELIKYSGFQVAPAELEGLLMDNPAVNDVAVIGVNDPINHTELPRAYVVPAPGVKRNEQSAAEIAAWVASKVAYYKKLRGGVRFVDEIPKSAAGKILRRILQDKAKQEDISAGKRAKL